MTVARIRASEYYVKSFANEAFLCRQAKQVMNVPL